MRICPDCIHFDRCDYIFDGCLSNRDNKACDWYDPVVRYARMPCIVGDTIYFTGYGLAEELKVSAVNILINSDSFVGYVDARRPDGTVESIGFNVFGELAFIEKEAAENALNKPEAEE